MATPQKLALAKLSNATRMLSEVRDAPSAKLLMDIAAAAKHYAVKAKLGQEAINHAHSIRLQAETMLGGFMRTAPKNKGAKGSKVTGSKREPVKDDTPTLAQLGLTKKESSEAQFLAELAEQDPDEHRLVVENEKTVTQVRRAVRRKHASKRAAQIPKGKFRVLYADPPWDYGDKRERLEGATGASAHYPSMTIAALCDLPVAAMSAKDAVLFLWVTSPMLEACFDVIRAWGFKYKASFVWDKVKHNIGHYNSVRHEFLLVSTRGSCLPEIPDLVDSVQSIERSSKHSQKPIEFRALIDKLYPSGPRIELFARERSEGWEVYGNEL